MDPDYPYQFGQVPRPELVRLYSQLSPEFQAKIINATATGEGTAIPMAIGVSACCASKAKDGKSKFFFGFFAGLSLGLLVALASVLETYSLGSDAMSLKKVYVKEGNH